MAFDTDPTVVFAKGSGGGETTALRRLSLENDEFLDTVSEHPRYDIRTLFTDDRTGEVAGALYLGDFETIDYFDESMRVLAKSLDSVLEGNTNLIVSNSEDRRRLLVLSYSPTGRAAYYLWDRDAKSLGLYGYVHRSLDGVSLSPVEAVAFEARDGLTIPAYLTVPAGQEASNLPTVVLVHAGRDDRADKHYSYLRQFLASRGYAVFEPNHRGSRGYGNQFHEAGRQQWGGTMQHDVTDGTRWLVEQGIADPDRVCLAGRGYGGYSAAMGAILEPDLYRCIVSINGVMHLPRYAREIEDSPAGSYWRERIGLGDASLSSVSPYHEADKIRSPMLIVQSRDGDEIPRSHGKDMAERLLKQNNTVEYLEIESGGRGIISVEERKQVLRTIEGFLDAHLGD